MRDREIAILIDALRPYCTDLAESELADAAERFLDYLDLTTDFYARHFTQTALTGIASRGTVEEHPSITKETNFPPS